MSDSETTKRVSPDPSVSAKDVDETVGAGLDVENPSEGSSKIKRTHTIIIDATSSTSTDVGVQATPAAVSADSNNPQKPQKGILHVTSDMRNSATKNSQNHSDNHTSATNTKEKTPMCLVNELARFNKVAHKYVLVDEKGPSHKKEFVINLDLGSESYQATGSSIKRAQHAAAEVALSSTLMNRPTVKSGVVEALRAAPEKRKTVAVTPTVELNALAMKMGEHAEYRDETPYMPHVPHNYLYPMPDYYYRYRMAAPMYNPFMPPHFRQRMPMPCSVTLTVGRYVFRGQGINKQLARHNAASRALKVLKNVQLQQQRSHNGQNKNISKSSTESSKPVVSSPVPSDGDESSSSVAPLSPTGSSNAEEFNGTTKSEISQVHELALRLNNTITFDVIHESGPPHMRSFVTRCVCGDLTSDGEGNSKRVSKKMAAEKMLAKLKDVELPDVEPKQKVKNVANKKKNRNLIKMQKANVEYGTGINPISRLIQIQQANKRKEPAYSLVMEHGLPRRREFIMQVECNDKSCQGKGPNKKLAKRNAAEEMLQQMGYSQQSPAPGKSVLKSSDQSNSSTHNKHVTFSDSTQSAKLPGVIVRKDLYSESMTQEMPPFKADLAASLARELLEKGKSVVGETLLPAKEHPKQPLKRAREQLEYLGSCMGFAMQFTDFPKGNNTNMCLTVVSLQTNPTQVFHGSASSVDDSHDKAALHALTKLASSARDDDSVEETTPPIFRKKIESEAVVKTDDHNASGDADVSTNNGDIKSEPEESKSTDHESDVIPEEQTVPVNGESQTLS